MELRNKETGAVITESEFRAAFPTTSFPEQLTVGLIGDMGFDVVLEGPQAQPTRYQTAFRDGVEEVNGKWFTKYSVADMDDETKAAKDAEQAKSMRDQRNQKLSDSDWTQLADSPENKAAWATYRQALRDVPTQAGFPWEVQWPQQPE
jgi:Phage tail assembly chaperone protein